MTDRARIITQRNKEYDELALQMIRFLKKWGMWSHTMILTNGNLYEASDEESDVCRGENRVRFQEKADAEEFLKGWTSRGWRVCAGPGHVFDMVYEGPLYDLLSFSEYRVRAEDLSEEAWEVIFRETDLLEEYLTEEYDLCTKEELLARTIEAADILNDPERSAWDPLEFDTWEEYLAFRDYEDSDLPNVRDGYDTYEAYREARDRGCTPGAVTMEDIEPTWNRMVETAKKRIRESVAELVLPQMAGRLKDAFAELFENHGLWYEYGFQWSLSAYPTRDDEADCA